METVPVEPDRTVMSPERVRTSRSTGPLTWNDRSKVPTTDAKPTSELVSMNNNILTARCEKRFITERLHRFIFNLSSGAPKHLVFLRPRPETLSFYCST